MEPAEPSQPGAVWPCGACAGLLEFDVLRAGETVACPHCGAATVLVVPEMAPEGEAPEASAPAVETVAPGGSGPLIVTTGSEVAGRRIESYLGIVRGIVVRSPDFMQGMFGGLKQLVGGNIESYAQVCEAARQQAYERMLHQARQLGADAIIAMRYDATEFTPGATEVLAYGTAVKLADT